MGMHMYQLESDGRLVFVDANRAADRILGLNNSQFIGKTIEEAKGINQESILKTCGGLPPEDVHCTLLASNTLLEAIALYEDSKK